MQSLIRMGAFVCALGIGIATLPAQQPRNDQERRDDQKPISDEQFVMKAASGGMYEVESSKLAKERATNKDVKSFAEQMIADHTKANKELMEAAKGAGTVVAGKMDEHHQKMLEQLKGIKGSEFDTRYIEQQVKAHEESVSLFTNASKNLKNPELKKFAEKTLPTLKKHQEHVKMLDKRGDRPGTRPSTQPRPNPKP